MFIFVSFNQSIYVMTKEKTIAFMPGDNVNVHITLKCSHYTILRVQAIEMDEPVNDEVNIDFD